MNKKAFTLAEVLITLVVIGVVAVIVIPLIVQNVQDAIFKAKLKENYSILTQAYSRFVYEKCGGDAINTTLDEEKVSYYFASILNYVKQCSSSGGLPKAKGNCWSLDYYDKDGARLSQMYYYYYKGQSSEYGTNYSSLDEGLILSNGSAIGIMMRYGDLTRGVRGYILLDVNGLSPPNRFTKDIFQFIMTSNKLLPMGSRNTPVTANCSYGYGEFCTADYLKN